VASAVFPPKARSAGGGSAKVGKRQGFEVVSAAPPAGPLVVAQAGASLSPPSPLPGDWVLEGEPRTSVMHHSTSRDGMATTVVWECTPGSFTWSYDCDETLYIIEGAATLTEPAGGRHSIGPGSIIYCPAGYVIRWDVSHTLRKVATERRTLPRSAVLAMVISQTIRRLLGHAPRAAGDSLLNPACD